MNSASPVQHFRSLHQPGTPLVLPNAWDVGSARIVANLGAAAVATTSAGVAWAHGTHDGGGLTPADHLHLARQLAKVTDLPVTMDIEDGYSEDPLEVAAFVAELAGAGVVGVNLEDSSGGVQRTPGEFASFLEAVRRGLEAGGTDVFVNARIDSYLLGTGESHADVIDRARAYLRSGADGVFLPALAGMREIAEACAAIPGPVNVMVPAGGLTVRELAAAGVARISTGMWLAQLAFGAAESAARSALGGSFGTLHLTAADYGSLNAHMTPELS